MPLIKATLKAEISTLLDDMRTRETVSDSDFADGLATAIDTYIKSAKITVVGIQTAGSPSAQSQTVPIDAIIS